LTYCLRGVFNAMCVCVYRKNNYLKSVLLGYRLRSIHGINSNPSGVIAAALDYGVSATTITRLARPVDNPKAASALSLDLASKIVSVLDAVLKTYWESL